MFQTIEDCGCVVRIKAKHYKTFYVAEKSRYSVTENIDKACLWRSWPYCAMISEVKREIRKGRLWDNADEPSNKGRIRFPKTTCVIDAPNIERVTTVEKRLKECSKTMKNG